MKNQQVTEPDRSVVEYAYGRLVTLIRRKFGVPTSDAQDIAAEALERALTKLPAKLEKPVTAWLTETASRIAIDQYRKRLRRAARAKDVPRPDPGFVPGDVATSRAQTAAARQRLLEAMDPDDRRYFEVWAKQRAGAISRSTAVATLDCTLAQYEAAKKRLQLSVPKLLATLGLALDDLRTEELPASIDDACATSTRTNS